MPLTTLRKRGKAADEGYHESPSKLKAKEDNIGFPSFFGGIFAGCTLMYMFLRFQLHWTVSDAITTSSPPALRSLKTENENGNNKNSMEPDDGWHDIHVFYGKRSALGEDKKQASYAQVHQDEVVLDLIGESGYFIDLAANDALELTNTIVLERYDGWNGLCIEPNPTYWFGLSHRKCTVVGALMGDKVQQVDVKFRGVFGGIVGKMDEKLANRKKGPKAEVEKRYTAPLREVLKRFNVPKVIDYMNLDIEGAEFMVLQHFPFEDYTIKVMTVERPKKPLKRLLEENGYVHLKDLAWWGETLWAHKSTGLTPEHPKIAKIVTEGK